AEYNWGPTGAKHQGAAYLDNVTINIVPENGVRLGSLRSKQVDAVANVPPRDADSLRDGDFQLLSKEQPGIAYTMILNAGRAPWTDVVLRRAIAKAVDPDQIVNTLYQGKYPRATSVLTSATPGYATILATSQFDRAGAERLLDQAGWTKDSSGRRGKDGRRLSVEWIYILPAREQRDLLVQLVQQQLKEVGVEVTLTPLSLGSVISRLTKGDWELGDISFARADGDVLRTVLTAPRGDTPATVAPEVRDLLSAAAATVDQAKRAASYEQAQRLIIDQATSIPIYNPAYLLGASKIVQDLTFDPQGLPSFYDTWVAR
ncbi:MAG: ABC transporter substrate-binding protein, partial [Pseudonocardiaceae bacterium]